MGNELTLSVNSFYWSFVVTGLLWLLCWYISLKAKEEGTWKYAVMALWNWLVSYGKELLGDYAEEVMPFLATFFVYILTANWLGLLPGFVAPTRDLSVTVGLALLLLIWIHAYAIRKNGMEEVSCCVFLSGVVDVPFKLDGTHNQVTVSVCTSLW